MSTYSKMKDGLQKYTTKGGDPRWRYVIRHDGTLYQKSGFRTEEDAKKARNTTRHDLDRKTHVAPTRETFGTYARTWIRTVDDLAPSTRRLHGENLERYLTDLHQRPLTKITPEEVRVWLADLRTREANTDSGTLSDWTVAQAFSLLRRVMNAAVTERKLQMNPCNGIRMRKPKNLREKTLLEHAEVLRLADAIDQHPESEPDHDKLPNYRAMILVAAFGGLRFSEAIALRRADINTEQGTVRVIKSKTEAGRRTVQLLSPIATEALEAHLQTTETDLVFASRTGRMIQKSRFYRQFWNPALSRANLSLAENGHRYTFHSLRHYALTLFGMSGATLQELMDWGGHSDVQAVMIYQHTDRQHLDDVVANAAARIATEGRHLHVVPAPAAG